MTRSLITGEFGFIDRHLAVLLAGEGHEVTPSDVVQDDALLRRDDELARRDWDCRPRYSLDEAIADFAVTVSGTR
jgi:nucleoside-diphosphate-sugar epimerase